MALSTNDDSRSASERARRSGPALAAMFRFLLWLIPTLDKFPLSQKFLFADRMQATALGCRMRSRDQGRAACCLAAPC